MERRSKLLRIVGAGRNIADAAPEIFICDLMILSPVCKRVAQTKNIMGSVQPPRAPRNSRYRALDTFPKVQSSYRSASSEA